MLVRLLASITRVTNIRVVVCLIDFAGPKDRYTKELLG